MSRVRFLLAALAPLLAAPASAQFDGLHNHLTCYKIKDQPVLKRVVLDDQFGRSLLVKAVPQFLCTPTQKTCCDPGQPGCVPVPCGADPIVDYPLPHLKCYRVTARRCTDGSCANLTRVKNGFTTVDVLDQFGAETVRVGPPQLLCAPAEKTISGATTTTTAPGVTTTTTIPCNGSDPVGQCGGGCPVGMACLATTPTSCSCVPVGQSCAFVAPLTCGGFCDNTRAGCSQLSIHFPCGCYVACGNSAPQCNGSCFLGGTCQRGPDGCTCPNGG